MEQKTQEMTQELIDGVQEPIPEPTTPHEVLRRIQLELKAPKSNYNKYGDYNYRNCEDILEAAKPLCDKYESTLILNDEIELIGERYYVKATATLITKYGEISAKAYAREELNKKGMDTSQLTGATSSYARKYALNGLFCIDDTKDADTMDNRSNAQSGAPKSQNQSNKQDSNKRLTSSQIEEIIALCDKHHKDTANLCKYFGIKTVDDMTYSQFQETKKIFKAN